MHTGAGESRDEPRGLARLLGACFGATAAAKYKVPHDASVVGPPSDSADPSSRSGAPSCLPSRKRKAAAVAGTVSPATPPAVPAKPSRLSGVAQQQHPRVFFHSPPDGLAHPDQRAARNSATRRLSFDNNGGDPWFGSAPPHTEGSGSHVRSARSSAQAHDSAPVRRAEHTWDARCPRHPQRPLCRAFCSTKEEKLHAVVSVRHQPAALGFF